MATIAESLKKKLISIIEKDFDECSFFMASSNMLTFKIKDIAESLKQDNVEFTTLRDSIGEIGIFISNTEKRLADVEECYTKLVEALTDQKTGK